MIRWFSIVVFTITYVSILLIFEIKEACVQVKTSKSLVDLYRSSILPKAEQTVQVSQAGYQTDKIDFLMLLDSQRSLLEFQLEYEQAKADYDKGLAELERSVGKDLLRHSSVKAALSDKL